MDSHTGATSANAKYILGLGNPIVDISANTDEETLKKYGLEFGRTVFCNDQNVGFYDLIEAQSDVMYIPGGSVTNSIRITNWMLNGSNDYGCMLLGCIGNDSYGNNIQEALNKAGVKSLLEIREDYKTSRCAVGIHLKERCLLPEIRASTMLSSEFVEKNLDAVSQADILLIEGYFVIEKYDIIVNLAKHFHLLNKKVAFTLSATFMVENFHDKLVEVCNSSHIVFCNNEEAEIFANCTSGNFEEVSEKIHKKLQPMDRILIVTCGKHPVVVSKYDYTENKLDFVLKSTVYAVDNDEIVDTNGCGDSWVGGFLSQYIQGASIEKCARAGNWAASVIIKNVGCTYPDNFQMQKF